LLNLIYFLKTRSCKIISDAGASRLGKGIVDLKNITTIILDLG